MDPWVNSESLSLYFFPPNQPLWGTVQHCTKKWEDIIVLLFHTSIWHIHKYCVKDTATKKKKLDKHFVFQQLLMKKAQPLCKNTALSFGKQITLQMIFFFTFYHFLTVFLILPEAHKEAWLRWEKVSHCSVTLQHKRQSRGKKKQTDANNRLHERRQLYHWGTIIQLPACLILFFCVLAQLSILAKP